VHIVVSEFTKALILDFAYRELDNVPVKSKEMAIAIFEPICKETRIDKATKRQLETLSRSA
jgi:adenylate cyclase